MLRTIMIGTAIFVQGVFVGALPGGWIKVQVGDRVFAGRPVSGGA